MMDGISPVVYGKCGSLFMLLPFETHASIKHSCALFYFVLYTLNISELNMDIQMQYPHSSRDMNDPSFTYIYVHVHMYIRNILISVSKWVLTV